MWGYFMVGRVSVRTQKAFDLEASWCKGTLHGVSLSELYGMACSDLFQIDHFENFPYIYIY